MIRLTPQKIELEAAAGDQPRRTFIGIAAPYGVAATTMDGTKVQFAEGSLPTDGPAPKLLEYHDQNRPVGIVMERVSIPGVGMSFAAKISDTTAGRDALTLIKDGVLTEVSVGVEPLEFAWEGDTMVVTKAAWNELSLVTAGAFGTQARIDTVYAQAQTDEPAPAEAAAEETPTPEGEPEMETPESIEASAPVETVPTVFAQARREFKLPSAAEYISAFVRGGAEFAQLNANIKAAAPDVITTDIPGVLPVPIVQPIYNNFRGLRPVIDASGARAMPAAGKVFIRPVVTTHNSVGPATENTQITQSTFVVDDVQITKGIYGGYADVSEASIDWSAPEILGAMLDDMSRVYANEVDAVACAELETCSQTNPLADDTDPADWITFLYTSASDILTNSNGNLPDTLYVDPTSWAKLGQLVDQAGRPLFPSVGPMNAFGSVDPGMYNGNAFGLRVVVDRNLSASTIIVGNSDGIEFWEDMRGAVSVNQPSTLSRQIAFRGYFAAKLIDDTKFVKVDNPA